VEGQAMPIEYTWKIKAGIVRIVQKPDKKWYLYLDHCRWEGPFNFPDQAADLLYAYPLPFPPDSGIPGTAESLGISDRLSDWTKVSTKR
jgi:hypothetical protein